MNVVYYCCEIAIIGNIPIFLKIFSFSLEYSELYFTLVSTSYIS